MRYRESEAGIAPEFSSQKTGEVHCSLVKEKFFHTRFVICFYIHSQRRNDVVF